MYLTCCGINHHNCTLAEREPFQLHRNELTEAINDFKRLSGAVEVVIIATCCRMEFYRVDEQKIDPRETVLDFYRLRGHCDSERLEERLFVRQGTTAARHLFKVAAGIDSALVGEHQVLGQVKDAYSLACSVGGTGKLLHKLFHHAFQIAKQVHSETEVNSGATGIAGAAVGLVHRYWDDNLSGLQAVVIGVNRSTEMILARLAREGIGITVANRTLYNAEKMVHPFGGSAIPLTELGSALRRADLLFSATSAPHFTVDLDTLRSRDDSKPLLAVDLAVPRDIDPSIATLSGITLLDLEDLKRYLNDIQREHHTDLPYALEMIEEQVTAFEAWRRRNVNGDGYADLRHLLDEDRKVVLERFRNNFRTGESKALEAFSRNLFRQFLRRVALSDVHQTDSES
ncbi:MAG: glutamyl-tRNA reductase [Candidatus Electryoneaceae bacterium]|nr:glutamyl-tRNA reductase [Candidatus Electryoneaceae bacterium]